MVAGGPNSLGDAYVSVHADTAPFDRELAEKMAVSAHDADRILDEVGQDWGKKISESTEKELGKHGPHMAREVAQALEKETIPVRPNFRYNVRDRNGRFTRDVARGLEEDIEEAFTRAVAPGGPFSKIGQAIADAIGAGFNISGKSPLILLLVPVVGAIVGLVAAAIQAVNALIATLTTLPGLVSSIAIQFAVLKLATDGLSKAITGAFAAKNAKELDEALKGLTPSAQEFVRSLLPFKDLLKEIKATVQENFFQGLGNVVSIIAKTLAPDALRGLAQVAHELGFAWNLLLTVFTDRRFEAFLDAVFKSTVMWIRESTPALVQVLQGLIDIGTAAIPFLNAIGLWVSLNLKAFGDFLSGATKSGDFKGWLQDMLGTLEEVGETIGQVIRFVEIFLAQLNRAGGKNIIKELGDAFEQLGFFLASPAGEKAMEGLVDVSIASIKALFGLAEAALLVLAALEKFGEWINKTGIPAIKEFFGFIGFLVVGLFRSIVGAIVWVGVKIQEFWAFLNRVFHGGVAAVLKVTEGILTFFRTLPSRITGYVRGFGSLLLNAGKDLIGGLIRGIESKLSPLKSALNWISDHIPDWKGPEEKDRKLLQPAGRAIMSGFLTGIESGANEVRDALTGITQNLAGYGTTTTNTHSVSFGPGAIQISFASVPTQQQALEVGQAVGTGINSQLSIRNINLGVRRM